MRDKVTELIEYFCDAIDDEDEETATIAASRIEAMLELGLRRISKTYNPLTVGLGLGKAPRMPKSAKTR